MAANLPKTPQLTALEAYPASAQINANSTKRTNMISSVSLEQAATMVPSAHYRCLVHERSNFRRASADLPRVIE